MKPTYIITDDRDITSGMASLIASKGEKVISFMDLKSFLEYLRNSLDSNQTRFIPDFDNGNRPTLKEIEQIYIADTIDHCNGNLSKASKILGISRSTIYRHLD